MTYHPGIDAEIFISQFFELLLRLLLEELAAAEDGVLLGGVLGVHFRHKKYCVIML